MASWSATTTFVNDCYRVLHHHHCPEDVAVYQTDAKEMGRLIPEADLCGRDLPDLGWEGGVDGDVDLQAIAREATVVMTNLSVGECTGIHKSPVPAEPCDPG